MAGLELGRPRAAALLLHWLWVTLLRPFACPRQSSCNLEDRMDPDFGPAALTIQFLIGILANTEDKGRAQETSLHTFPQARSATTPSLCPAWFPLRSSLLCVSCGLSSCLPGGDGRHGTFCIAVGWFVWAALCLSLCPSAAACLSPVLSAPAGLLHTPQAVDCRGTSPALPWSACGLERVPSSVPFHRPPHVSSSVAPPASVSPCVTPCRASPQVSSCPSSSTQAGAAVTGAPLLGGSSGASSSSDGQQLWRAASRGEGTGSGCAWPGAARRPTSTGGPPRPKAPCVPGASPSFLLLRTGWEATGANAEGRRG